MKFELRLVSASMLLLSIVGTSPISGIAAAQTTPWYLQRVAEVGEAHWNALETAIDVGVNIAMGTDQMPFEPNSGTVASVHELELYVEAGMTPLQALQTATIDAARMLGEEDALGSIERGKLGDIIAVEENPLDDISALRTLGFVMKSGEVVRNDWEIGDRS